MNVSNRVPVLPRVSFLPDIAGDEAVSAKNFIHEDPQETDFGVIHVNPDRAILGQKLFQQRQPRIHHAQPAVMPVQRFSFFPDDLTEPFADDRAVDVVVVGPAFVAGVVGRIDADAFHLTGEVREQGFEGDEIVTLRDDVAASRIAAGELRHILEQVEGNFQVVFDDGILADPVEGGHGRVRSRGSGTSSSRTSNSSVGLQGTEPRQAE